MDHPTAWLYKHKHKISQFTLRRLWSWMFYLSVRLIYWSLGRGKITRGNKLPWTEFNLTKKQQGTSTNSFKHPTNVGDLEKIYFNGMQAKPALTGSRFESVIYVYFFLKMYWPAFFSCALILSIRARAGALGNETVSVCRLLDDNQTTVNWALNESKIIWWSAVGKVHTVNISSCLQLRWIIFNILPCLTVCHDRCPRCWSWDSQGCGSCHRTLNIVPYSWVNLW